MDINKLIVGSRAIDRMREEVEILVNMFVGFLERQERGLAGNGASNPWAERQVWEIRDGLCGWKVYRSNKDWGYGDWTITPSIPFNSFFTQTIHASLPTLIEGLLKTFPPLEKRCQQFLKAADYAEKQGW